jgi:hypothetical protein
MRVTRAVCTVYVVVCLGALFLIPAGALGWLGGERDSMAGLFPHLLGMPWSLLVAQVANAGVFGRVVLVAAAMALNLAIIFSVGRWLARRA